MRRSFAVALVLAASSTTLGAVSGQNPIDDFSLPDARGKTWSLSDFSKNRFVAVVFVGVDCPLMKIYALRLAELSAELGPQGVAFLAVDSNRQDSLAELASFAKDAKLDFPVVKDPGNAFADRLGAVRTPEVFLLDEKRVVRYRGRIDDQYGVGVQRPRATRRDLAEAIHELSTGKEVSVPSTPALGCFIGRNPKQSSDGSVVYSRQISRILQEHCVECHRPGEVAPFSLVRYDEVVGWAESIREVVDQERMPPWFADRKYGKFRHDGHLTAEDKELIAHWVSDGCPQGDPKELPPPKQFVEGWGMPEPHVVFPMSDTPFEVPATGFVDYQYYTIDPGWKEDKWICGSEARPDAREVVHHILVFIKRPKKYYISQLPGELVSAYAPGMKPTIADPGSAVLAPAGSKIVLQVHYTPNGRPHRDLSRVGFKFAKKEDVQYEVKAGMAIDVFFRIPPNAPNHRVVASYTFPRDATLLGVNPHMHLRGKSFTYEALYPDGRREILMDCPRFDFNWQLGYQYVEPIPIPKGTKIQCTATFDNSSGNPSNPDPNRAVKFGEQTTDEMLIGWFFSAEKIN